MSAICRPGVRTMEKGEQYWPMPRLMAVLVSHANRAVWNTRRKRCASFDHRCAARIMVRERRRDKSQFSPVKAFHRALPAWCLPVRFAGGPICGTEMSAVYWRPFATLYESEAGNPTAALAPIQRFKMNGRGWNNPRRAVHCYENSAAAECLLRTPYRTGPFA